MGTKLSDLTEATTPALTDIMHLRTTGGVDKKITTNNLFAFIESITKGYVAIQFSGTGGSTLISAFGACEIDGIIYSNTGNLSISGVTTNNTWYAILLTPSGSSYTASYTSRGAGVWSDSKHGLYVGNNRIIGCVYKNSSGNFINKNIFNIINRTIKIGIDIGIWDMVATTTISLGVGFTLTSTIVNNIEAIIYTDSLNQIYPLNMSDVSGNIGGTAYWVGSANIGAFRTTSGFFDTTAFNDGALANRGKIYLTYNV